MSFRQHCQSSARSAIIMSAPIVAEGKVVGVLQVSHKGASPENAGAPFLQNDLRDLVTLSSALGRLVKARQVL